MCVSEFLQKGGLITAVTDVVANIIGFSQSQHDEIMSRTIAKRTRTGGFGFFVLGLPMNDRSRRFARVFPDPFPHTHHVTTGGVDNLATPLLDLLQDG